MSKSFYKHKLLLDENLFPRRFYPLVNERFDVKHVRDDLKGEGTADPEVFALALAQSRIILTSNARDFRPLLREDTPGLIGVPPTWSPERVDSKLTALLTRHGPNYFRGRFLPLSLVDEAN